MVEVTYACMFLKKSSWTYLILPFISSILFFSCGPDYEADIAEVEINLDIKRTDSLMGAGMRAFQRNPDLEVMAAYQTYLKQDKAFWFEYIGLADRFGEDTPEEVQDSLIAVNIGGLIADPRLLELMDSVVKVFPEGYDFEAAISPVLKRFTLIFPEVGLPAFRTHVNGYIPDADLSYVDQIVSVPGYISFGLHYFLGETFSFYPPTIPQFVKRRFQPDYMEVVLAKEIAEQVVGPIDFRQNRALLDNMVHTGIKQYLVGELIPHQPDSVKLFYTTSQMEWAEYYEQAVYKEIIDVLYDSDFKLQQEYLGEKPYTTSLSMESAPRLGQFTGWKIVESYMKNHPEVSVADLCAMTDYQLIFRESRYKP